MGLQGHREVESQVNSAAVEAIALYSALTLERATVGCFLELQEMQLLPRKVQYPEFDRRVVVHLAQSVSEKPQRSRVLKDKIR